MSAIILKETEKRILSLLDLDARMNSADLGRRIGISREAVRRCIAKLESTGVIGGYSTIINIALLGYTPYGVFLQFGSASPKRQKILLKRLEACEDVYWISAIGGNYDLLFGIQARSILEFERVYNNLTDGFDELGECEITTRVKVSHFRRDYLFKKTKNSNSPYFGMEVSSTVLDGVETKLLKALRSNGRISTSKLVEKTGMTRSVLKYRMDQLEKKGIIQSYITRIQAEKYNMQVYQVLISTKNRKTDLRNKLYEHARNNPHATFFVECVGKWNYEISLEVPNQKQLHFYLMELRHIFGESINKIELLVTFNYYLKYW